MKVLSDVIFCIGDAAKKRFALNKSVSSEFVFADNDEVFACFNQGEKTFFVFADLPYGDMTVEEFIAYNRSVIDKNRLKNGAIRKFIYSLTGSVVSVKRKIRTLDVFEYRAVKILSLLHDEVKSVAVSFDGTVYSRRNAKKIGRFIAVLAQKYELFISVTDARFILKEACVRRYDSEGGFAEVSLKAFSKGIFGKKAAQKLGLERNIRFNSGQIKKIVVATN